MNDADRISFYKMAMGMTEVPSGWTPPSMMGAPAATKTTTTTTTTTTTAAERGSQAAALPSLSQPMPAVVPPSLLNIAMNDIVAGIRELQTSIDRLTRSVQSLQKSGAEQLQVTVMERLPQIEETGTRVVPFSEEEEKEEEEEEKESKAEPEDVSSIPTPPGSPQYGDEYYYYYYLTKNTTGGLRSVALMRALRPETRGGVSVALFFFFFFSNASCLRA
jgi:hypothetical protein